ncbi:MAG: dethiobiotin synthase [Victivallaceae bacterium]|nr:dethiobiotin synthase [Victivallaceae bacterium]
MNVFFITGIDTGSGKSVVTGLLARYLRSSGIDCGTAKLVQTGCRGTAEDIITHRRLEGRDLLAEDRAGLTCPYRFAFPASPHLAAELENRRLDPGQLTAALNKLAASHDCLLIEGAGGLLVPLTRDLLTADFIAARAYPLIVVSSGRLGSINHTLLTLDAAVNRKIRIAGVVYNEYPRENAAITDDSETVIAAWLQSRRIAAPVIRSPFIGDLDHPPVIDFSGIFRRILP